jgi:hypothetical protein
MLLGENTADISSLGIIIITIGEIFNVAVITSVVSRYGRRERNNRIKCRSYSFSD